MKNKKPMSTYEREMQNPSFRKQYKKDLKEFVLSELMLALMEGDEVSVRKLAKMAGLSPTTIQKMRSGKQKDMRVKNFARLVNELGFQLVLEKGEARIPVMV